MTMNKGDTIGKSKEAVFKSDLSNYREEVSRNILNEQVKGNVASMKDVTVMPEDENYATEIRRYIPDITEKYMGKLGIKEGNLYYVSKDLNDVDDLELAAELNMIDTSNLFAKKEGLEVGDYITYKTGTATYSVASNNTGYGTPAYIN